VSRPVSRDKRSSEKGECPVDLIDAEHNACDLVLAIGDIDED
jgi:hypothetical protein